MRADAFPGESQLPLCGYAEVFEAIANETIFMKLSPHTTTEQYEAAQKSLLLLRTELEQRISPFHFPSPTGFHRCIRHCCLDAVFRLKHLALLRVNLIPPALKQQGIRAEEVVDNLEAILPIFSQQPPTLPKDTVLGQERPDHHA